ncbi:MAG: hypothetical protein LBI57_01790 [Helicobacteraceae bacterium]|jgi:hypothetical protein|nr:hypothetical protein [Helicobacteraceae bacterium]
MKPYMAKDETLLPLASFKLGEIEVISADVLYNVGYVATEAAMIYAYQTTPDSGGDPYNSVRGVVNGVMLVIDQARQEQAVSFAVQAGDIWQINYWLASGQSITEKRVYRRKIIV